MCASGQSAANSVDYSPVCWRTYRMYDFVRFVLICFGGTFLLHFIMRAYEANIGALGLWHEVVLLGFAFSVGFAFDLNALRAGLLVALAYGFIIFMHEDDLDNDTGWLLYLYVCTAGFIGTMAAIVGSRIRAMFPRT